MSAVEGWLGGASRPGKATMKLLKYRFESNASTPKAPLERSPRQCMAPEFTMPRKVCVVMGPFMGWKSSVLPVPLMEPRKLNNTLPRVIEVLSPKLMGIGFFLTTSSGLPRSQAISSLSPKMWQLAHVASPLAERVASYNMGRP